MTISISLTEARDTPWDAIVIGAGMGGAATAFALAEAGQRVLVVERGKGEITSSAQVSKHIEDADERLAIGRWPTRISGQVDGRDFDFFAPLGAGMGGSTALYAAALDRFRQSDFAPRPHPDGGTLEWPFGYDDLAPFYARAEDLLEVTGTPDPLEGEVTTDLPAPRPLEPRDAFIFERLEKAGLHPYRLHSGYRFAKNCGPCLGRVCLKNCKRHAGNSFLDPALATGKVAVLSDTEVTHFDAGPDRVNALNARRDGGEARLTAKSFVLAAGTYFSPVLLLKSANEHWAEGLGNHHDQVGRNLMFHTGRSLAIWAKRGLRQDGPGKTIVFRDLYETDAGKFGEVQSTGAEAAYGNIVYALRQMLDTSRFARVPFLWHLARIPAFAAARLLGNAAIFELIMEDLPYADNRIVLDPAAPAGMRFHYRIREELRERFDTYSRHLSRRLGPVPHMWLNHGTSLNYGHPMGTCRIGTDPSTSVAAPDGRVHGLDNLYVADGAFMPSSGGTNPSLTIAAHGLRTGRLMAERRS